MKPLASTMLVALGAALGASARYWIGEAVRRNIKSEFPWATLGINLTGSFVLGFFLALSARHQWVHGWTLLIGVGLLGGFTTFSSFSMEMLRMIHEGNGNAAFTYAMTSVAGGLLAAMLGWRLGQLGA